LIAPSLGTLLGELKCETLMHAIGDKGPDTRKILRTPGRLDLGESEIDPAIKGRFVKVRIIGAQALDLLAIGYRLRHAGFGQVSRSGHWRGVSPVHEKKNSNDDNQGESDEGMMDEQFEEQVKDPTVASPAAVPTAMSSASTSAASVIPFTPAGTGEEGSGEDEQQSDDREKDDQG
jgi:hypothetical protein